MPPPLPSDEIDDVEVNDVPEVESDDDLDTIPAKAPKKNGKGKAVEIEEDQESAEEVDEDEEEEEEDIDVPENEDNTYAIEAIVKHDYSETGLLLYRVKWLGYENEIDQTWEPEENLVDGAPDVLKAYHKKIGGQPPPTETGTPAAAKRGRGGKRKASEVDSPAPASSASKKRTKTTNGDKNGLPVGDWEVLVAAINTIDENPAAGGKKTSYRVFITFKEGSKATLPMSVIRERCPQKLIDYYEQHLTFREAQATVDQDTSAVDDDNDADVKQEVEPKKGRGRGRAKK